MNKTMILVLVATLGGCNKKKPEEGTAPMSGSQAMGSAADLGSAGAAMGSAGSAAEPAKPVTGADVAKRVDECWGLWNDAKYDEFKKCFTADAIAEQPGTGMPAQAGPDAIVENSKAFKTAFPDMKGDSQLVLVNGNNAATVVLVSGTHTGSLKTPMGELPATNKKVGLMYSQIVETDGLGHAKHLWEFFDLGTMMGQLGA